MAFDDYGASESEAECPGCVGWYLPHMKTYVMVACSIKDMVLQNDLRINTLLPRESPLCPIGLEGILLILVLMEYGLGVG